VCPEDVDESTGSLHEQTWCCYLLPSSFLFDRSCKLLNLVLNVMGSLINGNSSSLLPGYHIRYAKGNSSRINAIVSVLLWMQQGMLRFSKFSIHIRKRLTIFHEAYARYRYNFASQVSHVHIHVLCFSVYVITIDWSTKEGAERIIWRVERRDWRSSWPF